MAAAPTRDFEELPRGGANDRGCLSVAAEDVREAEVLRLLPESPEAALLTDLPATHTPCLSLLLSLVPQRAQLHSSIAARPSVPMGICLLHWLSCMLQYIALLTYENGIG